MKISVINFRRVWFIFSGVLIVASLLSLIFFRLNFGIDFTGGSLMDLQLTNTEVATDEIRSLVESQGYGEVRVQTKESGGYLIRLQALNEEQHQALLSVFGEKYGEVQENRFDFVGPMIGSQLAKKAIWAIIAVLLLIVLYVAWAFRKVSEPIASWKYGVLTMITALHDVIIPLGVFSVLGHFYGYQIDSAFVAAILTILGYSINDTIVVFDRTRENLLKRSSSEDFSEILDRSVHQTLSRSINTSLTTLLALVAVYFFGGETTKQFSLALIIGIVTGTYSSIFIATPLLLVWERKSR